VTNCSVYKLPALATRCLKNHQGLVSSVGVALCVGRNYGSYEADCTQEEFGLSGSSSPSRPPIFVGRCIMNCD
jgi:hypothetical protein